MDKVFLTEKDLVEPKASDDIYFEDYVVHTLGFSYSDEHGVLLQLHFSQMPEKYRKPKLLSRSDDRLFRHVELVKEALGGRVLKNGSDYILNVAMNSEWVRAQIGEDLTINDLLFYMVEERDGVTVDEPEEMAEALTLAMSFGPTYVPFLFTEEIGLIESNVKQLRTMGKQIELCRDGFVTDGNGDSEFDSLLRKLGFKEDSVKITESVLLTIHSAYTSE